MENFNGEVKAGPLVQCWECGGTKLGLAILSWAPHNHWLSFIFRVRAKLTCSTSSNTSLTLIPSQLKVPTLLGLNGDSHSH